MNRVLIIYFQITLISLLIFSCKENTKIDLALKNVQLFDSVTKEVLQNKTVLIDGDKIHSVIDSGTDVIANKIIDANNRLVLPGFIDTHIHLSDVIGNYENAPDVIHPDSISVYKKKLSDEYLSHGVTVIRDAGSPEKWIDATIEWQENPEANLPDILLSGAAIISDEERKAYIGHVEVMSPEDAENKVEEYFHRGIRHIKLYWRLRLPELRSAYNKATSLGMVPFAHIDFNVVSIKDALQIGVKHYEHAYTPFMSVFNFVGEHSKDFNNNYKRLFPKRTFWTQTLAILAFVHSNSELKNKLNKLIDHMVKSKATLSTTIHLFGSIVNRTTHQTFIRDAGGINEEDYKFNEVQLDLLNKGFNALMDFCKTAYKRGVKLRIGTDCPEGGKAILSEMILLYEAGFDVKDIFQIVTLNGAEALNESDQYGSIKAGNKADLVMFEKNPFDSFENILAAKMVIKDGVIFQEQ